MQGLNYFSTEGAQAFEMLLIVVNTLEKGDADSSWAREMSKTARDQTIFEYRLQKSRGTRGEMRGSLHEPQSYGPSERGLQAAMRSHSQQIMQLLLQIG